MAKGYVTIPVGYKRMDAEPLLDDEVFGSMQEAEEFSSGPTAYPGKTVAVLENGKYVLHIRQEDGTLTPVTGTGQTEPGSTLWDTWEE